MGEEQEVEEEGGRGGCTMWSVNKDIISRVVAYVKQSLCKLTDFPPITNLICVFNLVKKCSALSELPGSDKL